MTYFVTGATGFIGRNLVERLLERDGDVYVLVRQGSLPRLEDLVERWDAADRIHPVVGDLTAPRLGLSAEQAAELAGKVNHFFHLAAVYDMRADDETNRVANVEGTRHAVELANAVEAGRFHHVSSIAAAGKYKGMFREDMFDEGQKLDHPYHRTKFESEKIARTQTNVPWRVYRPAVVVGHSQTGEMDKIDGPYYFFTAIKTARHYVPEWFPLVGPELGYTNIVPVDYVAAALDHIAHLPDLDGYAFHLCAPKSRRSGDVINTFAKAAHAPQLTVRVDTRMLQALPKGTLSMLMKLPAARGVRRAILADFGIPEEVLGYIGLTAQFDTREAERALEGSGISVAPSRPMPTSCGTTGNATSIPTCSRTAASKAQSPGRPWSSPGPRAGSAGRPRSRSRAPAESRSWSPEDQRSSRRPSRRSRTSAARPTLIRPISRSPSRSTTW